MKKQLLCILLVITYTPLAPHASISYNAIAQQMLKNFAPEKSAEKSCIQEKKKSEFKIPQLTNFEAHQSLLEVFHEHEQAHPEKYSEFDVLNSTSAVDLNLYFYDTKRPEYTLTHTFYRGQTLMGKVALAHRLATPLSGVEELKKRQAVIRWFMKNKKKGVAISKLLNTFSEHERQLLSLWNPNDVLYEKMTRETFFGGGFKKWQISGGDKKLELKRRLADMKILAPFLVAVAIAMGQHGVYDMIRPAPEKPSISETAIMSVGLSPSHSAPNAGFFGKSGTFIKNWAKNPVSWALMPLSLFSQYPQLRKEIGEIISRKKLGIHIRQRMQSLVHFDKLASKLYELLKDEKELIKILPCFAQLEAFVNNNETTDHKLLLKTIRSSSFKGNSYFFANIGKVLHSIPQFLKVRNSFAPAMSAIGIIDAQVGLSQKMDELTNAPASLSFANYQDEGPPHVALTDFWHPMINPHTVVTNSVTMGKNSNVQNMVLTGPNASGKSTILKAITLCILLGQTLGIVPAKHATFTPFDKITTYLNIIDNLGEDQSLFKAEVARAQELLNTVKNLKDGKRAFTVMDEIFSATAPREGEAAAFGVGYSLAQVPHALTIIATHFARLTTLARETNGAFSNYKVFVEYNKDGSFTHPFLLKPGRSHQVIALDLMRKDGFESKILEYANQFLKAHPAEA